MLKKIFNTQFVELGIKAWIKLICKNVKIQNLKIIKDNKLIGKFDELYLEATDLIYKNLHIKKVIISIYDFNLKFYYKNHPIYSNDMVVNCFLKIDSGNLKNTILKNKLDATKKYLENQLTEGNNLFNLEIKGSLIKFFYQKGSHQIVKTIALKAKENNLFLEDIVNKQRVILPLDKNIRVRNCLIKNEILEIDLSSKVIFDNQ